MTTKQREAKLRAVARRHAAYTKAVERADQKLAERNEAIREIVGMGFSQAEVGRALGVGRERISQIAGPPRRTPVAA